MNVSESDWQRLDRYVAGEGTAEEREELRRWIDGNPELQALVEVMRTAQRLPTPTTLRWDSQTSWREVSVRLGLAPKREPAGPVLELVRQGRRRTAVSVGLAVATAAAVFLVVGQLNRASNESARRSTVAAAAAAAAADTGREYAAPRGQRVVIRLPDGTEATLAPETRLTLLPRYGKDTRAVGLIGKAYFVVTHDSTMPFSVVTDRLIARDLGTRFGVRAYSGDSTRDVVVAEGRVALQQAHISDVVLLEAGDRGRLTRSGTIARSRNVAVDQLLGWVTGGLVFRRVPLGEVVAELGRWYDVDIRLAQASLSRESVTASFQDESIDTAIGLLATAAGLTVERASTRYTLRRTR